MTDTDCFLQAVREYRSAELAMGRILPAFEDWNTSDRSTVLARAQELKEKGTQWQR